MPYDHKNNFYASNADMAKIYNLKPGTLKYRLREWTRHNKSLEYILTTPVKGINNKKCCESSIDVKCKTNSQLYQTQRRDIIGPDGKLHKNITWIEICKLFDIKECETFRDRLNTNLDIQNIAKIQFHTDRRTRCIPCTDHKGNQFDSIYSKCIYWNIPYETYSARIHRDGWSEQKALETPIGQNQPKSVLDPNNIWWESISKMCKHWQINRKTYEHRMNSGNYTMLEALTNPT